MRKRKWIIAAAMLACLCAGLLAGCGDKEEAEEIKPLGKIYEATLENATGKAITGLETKDSAAQEFSENKLLGGDIFAKEEKRRLVCDATKAVTDAEADAQCDIRLTFDDGRQLVLTDVPFSDMEQCQICLEDEVAFLTYTSLKTEEEVSTKDAELKLKAEAEKRAAEEAKRKAEEEAKKKAEEEARKKAEAEAAARAAQQRAAAEQAARQRAAARQTTSRSSGGNTKPRNSDGCIGNDEKLLY
ncbi:hypothetical protein D3Z38_09800 [Clostridiales bacterium]|nr:hypothetical protein [Clostridiales bacterium]